MAHPESVEVRDNPLTERQCDQNICLWAALRGLYMQAGLIYLPFGLGGTASTFFVGRLLDGAYRRARTMQGLPTDKAVGDDLDDFPIEKARLSVIWIPLLVTAASVVALGWVLHYGKVRSSLLFSSTVTIS